MVVNPLPGAGRNRLRDSLRELGSAVSNLRSSSPGWQSRDWLTAYIEWANNAASILRGQIAPADIDRLVWTGRYHLLASKVSDPPGHVRLPITDDEIIDRLAVAQALADRQITLVTYDTGQALRAGLAGLDALRLQSPIEQEPEPST